MTPEPPRIKVTIRNATSQVTLTKEQIAEMSRRLQAALQDQARRPPRRYNYPDQSIASMTPEQAGEVVESFRMDIAEGLSGPELLLCTP